MDTRRRRFVVALFVFVVWVTSLAVLAVSSGRRPIEHPPAAMPR